MAPAFAPSDTPPEDVLARLPEAKRQDAEVLVELMSRVTGERPVVWAGKVLGFGSFDYRYDTGRTGTAPLAAFAPTSRQHTLYLSSDFTDEHADLVARLGSFTHGRACLYVKKLADVDLEVLEELVALGVQEGREADVSR
jgi:hypothetical protein